MPIYEFVCERCQRSFEELTKDGQAVRCPSCGAPDVRRLLSRFAVRSSSPDRGGGGAKSCSTCSGSHCATCH